MNDNSNIKQFKINFLGEPGVGKTSIISQFIYQKFLDSQNLTVGYYHKKTITIDDKPLFNFDIWDIPRQEKYRALARIFYKNANAVILVYDITQKKTFDELKNYWIHDIQKYGDILAIVVIVANKYELTVKNVYEGEVLEFVENINAMFCHTSAKEGMGINELFNKIVKKLIKQEEKLKKKK